MCCAVWALSRPKCSPAAEAEAAALAADAGRCLWLPGENGRLQGRSGPRRAILAGVGAGLYPNVQEACRGMIQTNPAQQPDAQASEQYERFYQVYQSLYPALRESFQRLSKL